MSERVVPQRHHSPKHAMSSTLRRTTITCLARAGAALATVGCHHAVPSVPAHAAIVGPRAFGDSAALGARIVATDPRSGVTTVSLARAASYIVLGVTPGRAVEPFVHANGSPMLGIMDAGVREIEARVSLGDSVAAPSLPGKGAGYEECVRRLAPTYYRPQPTPTGRDSLGRPVVTAADRRAAEVDARDAAESAADKQCRRLAAPTPTVGPTSAGTRAFDGAYVLFIAATRPFDRRDVDQRIRRLRVKAPDAASILEAVAEGVAAGHGEWAAYAAPWAGRGDAR